MPKLTALGVRNAPPGKHEDGNGLRLVKRPDGGGKWVFRYTLHGRRREMGLGSLAALTLKDAREIAAECRKLVVHDGKFTYDDAERALDSMRRLLEAVSASQAVRSSLAWDGVVRDAETGRLNLRTTEIAQAKEKAMEVRDTAQTRMKETWCFLIYPYQDTAQSDVELTSARIPAQDGVLGRASKKLVSDEALLPEIGPERLNRELEKNIWNGKQHLHLKDLWEYLIHA